MPWDPIRKRRDDRVHANLVDYDDCARGFSWTDARKLLGGLPGGGYSDSGGAAKVGYCVCQVANADGKRTWSCASDTAWPCPLGAGC